MKTALLDTFLFDKEKNEIIRGSNSYSSSETVYDMSGRLIEIRGNRDGSIFEYGQDGNISAFRYSVTGTVVKEILFTFTNGKLSGGIVVQTGKVPALSLIIAAGLKPGNHVLSCQIFIYLYP